MISFHEDKIISKDKKRVQFGRLSNKEGKQKPFRKSQFCLYASGEDLCCPAASEVKYLYFFLQNYQSFYIPLCQVVFFCNCLQPIKKSYC